MAPGRGGPSDTPWGYPPGPWPARRALSTAAVPDAVPDTWRYVMDVQSAI